MRPSTLALLVMALPALGSAACATSGAVPRPFPGAPVGVAQGRPSTTPPSGEDSESSARGASPDPAVGEAHATPPPVDPDPPIFSGAPGRALAEFALGFRGVPYRLGGADPAGFDCSGLVQYVFAQYGIFVPRVVEQQYEIGDKIKPSQIQPGDLIFFNTKRSGSGVSHVAIALGEDRFVHAPNSAGVVRVETLGSAYWAGRYVGTRRITPSTTSN
jgi:cell wall-associated NlpC family hydrolase